MPARRRYSREPERTPALSISTTGARLDRRTAPGQGIGDGPYGSVAEELEIRSWNISAGSAVTEYSAGAGTGLAAALAAFDVAAIRDPRAEVLSKVAEEMAGAVLYDRRPFDLARDVEATILRVLDEVKPGRNLRTNVEFYTALVLQSIGLRPESFVAVFSCGRCAGWCAHVIEQHAEDRLIRPQSEYIGTRPSDR